jgi:hypothetical protein
MTSTYVIPTYLSCPSLWWGTRVVDTSVLIMTLSGTLNLMSTSDRIWYIQGNWQAYYSYWWTWPCLQCFLLWDTSCYSHILMTSSLYQTPIYFVTPISPSGVCRKKIDTYKYTHHLELWKPCKIVPQSRSKLSYLLLPQSLLNIFHETC